MMVECAADMNMLLHEISMVSRAGAPMAVDTETTGLAVNRINGDKVTGVSVTYEHPIKGRRSWYVPIGHIPSSIPNAPQDACAALQLAICDYKGTVVMHHSVFDTFAIEQIGPHEFRPAHLADTLVQAWLLDENASKGLKTLGKVYFGEDADAEQKALKKLMGKDKSWANLTAEQIRDYACKDTELTLGLYEVQNRVIEHGGPGVTTRSAVEREMAFQQVVWRLNNRGIRIDRDAVVAQREVADARATEIANQFEGVNLNSTPQLCTLLYETYGLDTAYLTPTGAKSTKKEALEALMEHPAVPLILEYRSTSKAVSTYYDALLRTADPDERVRPWFSSFKTVTGRLSCSDPNLMTIPRGDTLEGVRECFIPAEGYELWEYDLSSAELRVQAGLSQDKRLNKMLAEGLDFHDMTAEAVFGPGFSGLQRRLAKNLNYGYTYGIGAAKFATYMVASTGGKITPARVRQAREILDGYAQAYPGLRQLMTGLANYAQQNHFVPLHKEGRFRHFRSPNKIVPAFHAINSVVQGGIAELMKDIMLAVPDTADYRLCLQVHDSLVFEVRPGYGPKLHKHLQEILDDVSPFKIGMRFDAQEWSDHE